MSPSADPVPTTTPEPGRPRRTNGDGRAHGQQTTGLQPVEIPQPPDPIAPPVRRVLAAMDRARAHSGRIAEVLLRWSASDPRGIADGFRFLIAQMLDIDPRTVRQILRDFLTSTSRLPSKDVLPIMLDGVGKPDPWGYFNAYRVRREWVAASTAIGAALLRSDVQAAQQHRARRHEQQQAAGRIGGKRRGTRLVFARVAEIRLRGRGGA